MNNVTEFLPFLVPLVISELALLAYTLYHILTHKSYKRGNRTLWLIVVIVGMQFIGPILYFLLGYLSSVFTDAQLTAKDTLLFLGEQFKMFEVLEFITEHKILISKIERVEPSLESLFMEVVSK